MICSYVRYYVGPTESLRPMVVSAVSGHRLSESASEYGGAM